MMTATVLARAIAVDVRDTLTTERLGVALIVLSERRLWMLTDAVSPARERTLQVAEWNKIEQWVEDGDAGLPARPAPLGSSMASVFLADDRPSTIGERFASMTLETASQDELPTLADRVLHELLGPRH